MDCIVYGITKSPTRQSDFHFQVCHSFSSKEQAFFNFMATVTVSGLLLSRIFSQPK